MKPNIAFVGVGRMGANMARCLKDAGYSVAAVFDHHAPLAQDLAKELECAAPTTLAEVSAAADVIFTVVTDDDSMREIFSNGLLTAASGKTFFNCATVSPDVHREIESQATDAGAKSLEACMASSITQARDGTLYLMMGGDKATFDQHRDLLDTISSDLFYIGEAGKASEVKALVNMVMNANTAALAEGLGLGAALGLDLDTLRKVFSNTGANSRVLETDSDDMLQRDHECYFSAAHAAKDSGIANALAEKAGVSVPISRATEAQYRALIDAEKGDLDKSAVAELTFPGRNAQS